MTKYYKKIFQLLDDVLEASGEEPTFKLEDGSSIRGIPKVMPKFSRTPPIMFNTNGREYRRKQPSSYTEFAKPAPRTESFIGSMLDLLGFELPKYIDNPKNDIERLQMQLFYDQAKQKNSIKRKNIRQKYNNAQILQHLQPSSTKCNLAIDTTETFNIDGFMGQWYQVMYSSTESISKCRIMSLHMLNRSNRPYGIDTSFETLEISKNENSFDAPVTVSGFGNVHSAGELHFRNMRRNANVNIIHTGPVNRSGLYEYVIFTEDCYYPIFVFARDPIIFKQKYEQEALQIMRAKGLINDFSQVFNFIKTVDFSTCQMAPTLFTG
uniref:Uncharacterized protein n=1 Tax=Panagrolaimus sp. ES5 TaxID=591445 RepID=A0AC34G452_9BILA